MHIKMNYSIITFEKASQNQTKINNAKPQLLLHHANTVESPLDSKEIQSVNPKGNQSWIFFGRTDVEAEAPILWSPDVKSWLTGKDPDAGKGWAQEEKGVTEDKVVRWHHHSMEVNLSKLWETVKDREVWHAAVHEIAKSQTWLSNWTTTIILCSNLILQLDEVQAGIKIDGRNINNLGYADDTTLMAESEEELKIVVMKVKEESEKDGLKLNIQKTKIMASGPIISWQMGKQLKKW